MSVIDDFEEIIKYAHYWNWVPDWELAKDIYNQFPDSYSILTPFAYSYLEEIIRSTTSEYGKEFIGDDGKEKKRKVGIDLINMAISENRNNKEYNSILKEMKKYFEKSKSTDSGNNRNSVDHGYLHPRFWNKKSFEELIYDISKISKFAKF